MTHFLDIQAELTDAAWNWIEKFPSDCDAIVAALNSGSYVFLNADGFVASSPCRSMAQTIAQHYETGCLVMLCVDSGFVFTRQAIIDGHF